MLILILMMTSLLMSIYIMMLKHPMSMGLTLMIQTIVTSLTTGFFNNNYWYSYILFLIMVGGMLVLFIYMTSIASNEMFYLSIKLFLVTIMLFILMLFMMLMFDPYYYMMNNDYQNIYQQTMTNLSLNKYLNFPNNLISYLLIMYLLITLIAVVKITNFKKGALRSSN